MKHHLFILIMGLSIATLSIPRVAIAAEARVPGPESLGLLSRHAIKYDYCPTDHFPSANKAAELATAAGIAVVCTPGILICAGVTLVGVFGALINDSLTSAIRKGAKQVCADIPPDIAPAEKADWQRICDIVVDSANRNALNVHDGLVPDIQPPLKMTDPVLEWHFNGQPVEQVEALRQARDRLRSDGYPICYSEPSVVQTLKQHPALTLREIVRLTFDNIKEHGSRLFFTPHNDFLSYTQDDVVYMSKDYLYSRMHGQINAFDDLWDTRWRTLVEILPLPTRYRIQDVDQAALKVVKESYYK